jgi:isocitrate lyase
MLRRLAARVPRRTSVLTLSCLPSPARASRRSISATAATRIASALPPVDPPVSKCLPSDSFQLLPEAEKAGFAEDALYERQVEDVEAWWRTPRYEGIKRPYTAADVVSKRGSQQQSYVSSVMARKLWKLIRERESEGRPIHTSTSYYAAFFKTRPG